MLHKLFFHWMYWRKPPWDTGISPPELIAFIENHPPGRALDLGCGTGTNVITLSKAGWQAVGVDFVGKAIRKARRKAHQAGIQASFYVDDVTRLENINGRFDLILDIGCFHSLHPDNRSTYLRNLERLLAPNGTYLLYAFIKENDQEERGLGQADLQALNKHFSLLERQDGSERGLRPSAWFKYSRI
ncbi:MAG: class I SAM-dependent methyltransferase [Anaerolineales bacterium]|jgi:cyclopropane fatty-acyl-phospholipid synthase-like methyltransferase